MMIREIIKSVPVSQRIQHVLVMNLMTVSFIYMYYFISIDYNRINKPNQFLFTRLNNQYWPNEGFHSNQPFRSPIEGD